ncbi:hypothetical protein NDU88_003348 [Pleurodeles waltl]|uniref:Uncharacterized protein n=1 Tax=Pleurodeles waltl TaxID=8319 RepID=A0AAV7NGE4_PLEWA|nr:hypothetical protein NDU88_003348 [Pleurodeles waltl]
MFDAPGPRPVKRHQGTEAAQPRSRSNAALWPNYNLGRGVDAATPTGDGAEETRGCGGRESTKNPSKHECRRTPHSGKPRTTPAAGELRESIPT